MSDIYLFQVASRKSQWLSARQIAVADNIANVNSPGYRAVDVHPFSTVLDASPIALAATELGHIEPADPAAASLEEEADPAPGEESISGNTVNLEHELINLGAVSRDYSMTANIRRVFHQLMLAALK